MDNAQKTGFGLVAIAIVAIMAGGTLVDALFGEDQDLSRYPACADIVQYPGTDYWADCVDDDNIIDVGTHPQWDHYHPAG